MIGLTCTSAASEDALELDGDGAPTELEQWFVDPVEVEDAEVSAFLNDHSGGARDASYEEAQMATVARRTVKPESPSLVEAASEPWRWPTAVEVDAAVTPWVRKQLNTYGLYFSDNYSFDGIGRTLSTLNGDPTAELGAVVDTNLAAVAWAGNRFLDDMLPAAKNLPYVDRDRDGSLHIDPTAFTQHPGMALADLVWEIAYPSDSYQGALGDLELAGDAAFIRADRIDPMIAGRAAGTGVQVEMLANLAGPDLAVMGVRGGRAGTEVTAAAVRWLRTLLGGTGLGPPPTLTLAETTAGAGPALGASMPALSGGPELVLRSSSFKGRSRGLVGGEGDPFGALSEALAPLSRGEGVRPASLPDLGDAPVEISTTQIELNTRFFAYDIDPIEQQRVLEEAYRWVSARAVRPGPKQAQFLGLQQKLAAFLAPGRSHIDAVAAIHDLTGRESVPAVSRHVAAQSRHSLGEDLIPFDFRRGLEAMQDINNCLRRVARCLNPTHAWRLRQAQANLSSLDPTDASGLYKAHRIISGAGASSYEVWLNSARELAQEIRTLIDQ